MDIYAQHIELCNQVLRHADPDRWDRDEAAVADELLELWDL